MTQRSLDLAALKPGGSIQQRQEVTNSERRNRDGRS